MSTNPLTKTAPTAAPTASPTPSFEVVGSEAAFLRFLPAAQAIDALAVVPFRADASLAYHNVAAGVAALMPLRQQLTTELPKLDFADLATLPDLALGVLFAGSQVNRVSLSQHETAGKLAEARSLRELMLTSATALAIAGLVEARTVEKIREGTGAIDSATDCVDLASLFRNLDPAIRARTPVTTTQIARAAELGTALLEVLKPKLAHKGRTSAPELAAAVAARNRMWTLLVQRHDLLRRVACWVWGEDAMDAHVPPLQSRRMPEGQRAKGRAAKTARDAAKAAARAKRDAAKEQKAQEREAAKKQRAAERLAAREKRRHGGAAGNAQGGAQGK